MRNRHANVIATGIGLLAPFWFDDRSKTPATNHDAMRLLEESIELKCALIDLWRAGRRPQGSGYRAVDVQETKGLPSAIATASAVHGVVRRQWTWSKV